MNPGLAEALRVVADRGVPSDPDALFDEARRRANARRLATRTVALSLAVVVAVGLAATIGAVGRDTGEERVTTSDQAAAAADEHGAVPTNVALSDTSSVWPNDKAAVDRSSPEIVASNFVAAVTGEAPAASAARRSDAVGPAPTYVDVTLQSGASVEVLTAPEGSRGWRILQVGQPASTSSSGAVMADMSYGPVEVGKASPVRMRFQAPVDATSGEVYYATPVGTFLLKLTSDDIAEQQVVLPNTHVNGGPVNREDIASQDPADLRAVAVVYRSDDGSVVAIRAQHTGRSPG